MFKIIQEKEHKVIKIFGLKIKFKSKDKQIFIKNEIYMNGKRVYELHNNNIQIYINGENNIIKLNDFSGNGKLIIDLKASKNCRIEFGKNNSISLWASICITSYPHAGCNFQQGKLFIGNNNIFNGHVSFTLSDSKNAPITIGDNNLFAGQISFKALSDHLVYDIKTKKQINIEKGINIDNHNWICEKNTFLNKAKIGSNCVVGMMSIVNRDLNENNCVIAGIPAEIRRRNINWDISVKPEIID